jgi:amino acid transporter
MPDAIAKAPGAGGVFNLPAVVLVGSCLILLLRGVKESVTVNAVLVVLKLLVLLFFVVIAFSGFHAGNLTPFMPMGMAGMGRRPRRSSSPISASTRSRRPATRSRTRAAPCRWASCSPC